MGRQHALDRDFAPPAEPCTLLVGPDGWRCMTCGSPWHMVLRIAWWRARWGLPESRALEHAWVAHEDDRPSIRQVASETRKA